MATKEEKLYYKDEDEVYYITGEGS